ncbi:hypothetical protein LWF15_11090 [Kineosporia rhizophila]|uniref:hypothetical protein n=1 Tax=Kineosporia rhizophila TaxID=84633 RepID=UPI001E59F63B|nr:hypothetical protein [Kineosporia rhizophila]MCE0536055.1 hypothetical protein [Kineosporia rhizophila]
MTSRLSRASPAIRWTGRAVLVEVAVDGGTQIIELVARRDDITLWQGEHRTLAIMDRDRFRYWLSRSAEGPRGASPGHGSGVHLERASPRHAVAAEVGTLLPSKGIAHTSDMVVDDIVWSRRSNGALTLTVDALMPYHLGPELSAWLTDLM